MPTKPVATPPPEVEPKGVPAEPTAPDQPQPDSNGWSADGTDTAPPEWNNWAYNGPDRTYSQIPITATTGTTLRWHHDPGLGDGCWTRTDDEPNALPDNHRPEPTEAEAAKLRGDDDTRKEG